MVSGQGGLPLGTTPSEECGTSLAFSSNLLDSKLVLGLLLLSVDFLVEEACISVEVLSNEIC